MINASASGTSLPARVRRLQSHLQENGIDLALISGEGNVMHQSGYSRYYSGYALVVLPASGEPALIVPQFEVQAARETGFITTVAGYGELNFGLDLDSEGAALGVLPQVLRDLGHGSPRRLGLAGASPRALDALAKLGARPQAVELGEALSTIRQVKDGDEVEAITFGYQLCLRAQQAVGEAAQAGTTEIELYSLAQTVAQVANGAPVVFGADIQGGSNSAFVCSPISIPGPRALVAGDVLVADILVGARGYFGDTARTHCAGAMSAEVRAQLSELESIKRQAAERLKPGARGCDLFAWAQRTIESTFKGGEFPHHLGHAVGVTVFEDPHLIPADRRKLKEGMVIAVEPGVYFPGRYGLRTEDIYEVTPQGGRQLPTGA